MAASGAMLLIAVLLGIIGTILFIRGLARILSIWAASIKHKATRGLYVFTLRQLHENVVNKYISISVAVHSDDAYYYVNYRRLSAHNVIWK